MKASRSPTAATAATSAKMRMRGLADTVFPFYRQAGRTSLRARAGTKERGAVARASRCFLRQAVAYGPVQAFVVMSPPGPRLYQTLVPTWDLTQYETVFGVPTIVTF